MLYLFTRINLSAWATGRLRAGGRQCRPGQAIAINGLGWSRLGLDTGQRGGVTTGGGVTGTPGADYREPRAESAECNSGMQ